MRKKSSRSYDLPHSPEIRSLPSVPPVENEDPSKRLRVAPCLADTHPGHSVVREHLQMVTHFFHLAAFGRKRHQRWAGVRQNLPTGTAQGEHIVREQGMATSHKLSGERGLPAAGGSDEGSDSLRRAYSARVEGLETPNQAHAVKNGVKEKSLPVKAFSLRWGAEQRPSLSIQVEARLSPEGEQVIARLTSLTADVAVVGKHRLPRRCAIRVAPLTDHFVFFDDPESHVWLAERLCRDRNGHIKGRLHPKTVGAEGAAFHVHGTGQRQAFLRNRSMPLTRTRKNLRQLKVYESMDTSYVAFGLALSCPFPLPGMAPDEAEGLPSLALELVAPIELKAAWSGARGSSPWRGRLGDGLDLTIERGIDGDLLFAYGDRARFRLDQTGTRLECAPRDPGDLAWQRVLVGRILPNASIARGREALHASAVESPLGVIAIAAPSGSGKSTLAAELVGRGWPFFTDDVLVIDSGSEGARAHPGTPHLNLSLTSSAGPTSTKEPDATLGVLAGERWTAVPRHAQRARPVAAIVLLERQPGLTLAARPLPSSPLPLAPYMLGVPGDDREDRRFAIYSDLVDSAGLFRLSGDMTDEPGALSDAIERALELNAPMASRGAA